MAELGAGLTHCSTANCNISKKAVAAVVITVMIVVVVVLIVVVVFMVVAYKTKLKLDKEVGGGVLLMRWTCSLDFHTFLHTLLHTI